VAQGHRCGVLAVIEPRAANMPDQLSGQVHHLTGTEMDNVPLTVFQVLPQPLEGMGFQGRQEKLRCKGEVHKSIQAAERGQFVEMLRAVEGKESRPRALQKGMQTTLYGFRRFGGGQLFFRQVGTVAFPSGKGGIAYQGIEAGDLLLFVDAQGRNRIDTVALSAV